MKPNKNKGRIVSPSARRRYINNYWQLYAMMLVPLLYFLLFKYIPMFGNILAFRRYKPLTDLLVCHGWAFDTLICSLRTKGFIRAFKNTLTLSSMNLIINFPVPIISLLLNEGA